MVRTGSTRIGVAVFSGLAMLSTASAQVADSPFPVRINTEQNPRRNLSGEALAARAPGNLVTSALVRTVASRNLAQRIIEITEPLGGPDPKATFLSEAVGILFEQLNRTLLTIANAFLVREGLPPLVPIETPLSPVENGTTDETNTDDTTDPTAIGDQ